MRLKSMEPAEGTWADPKGCFPPPKLLVTGPPVPPVDGRPFREHRRTHEGNYLRDVGSSSPTTSVCSENHALRGRPSVLVLSLPNGSAGWHHARSRLLLKSTPYAYKVPSFSFHAAPELKRVEDDALETYESGWKSRSDHSVQSNVVHAVVDRVSEHPRSRTMQLAPEPDPRARTTERLPRTRNAFRSDGNIQETVDAAPVPRQNPIVFGVDDAPLRVRNRTASRLAVHLRRRIHDDPSKLRSGD